jgi:hypothetical protein
MIQGISPNEKEQESELILQKDNGYKVKSVLLKTYGAESNKRS